jgi:von Willebrand factor type A domain
MAARDGGRGNGCECPEKGMPSGIVAPITILTGLGRSRPPPIAANAAMRPDLDNPKHRFGECRPASLRMAGVCAGMAALAALAAPAFAMAALRIANVDVSGRPSVRLTVVTSQPTDRAPRVTENGQPVAQLTAQNLAQGKNVILAVDRSQSMRGQSLRDATQAAIRFVALKPASDQIEVVTFSSDTVFPSQVSSDPSEAESALRGIADDPGTEPRSTTRSSARRRRSQPPVCPGA